MALASAFDNEDGTCPANENENAYTDNSENVAGMPGWAVLLVAAVNMISNVYSSLVVPAYSIAVTLYLIAVYFRNELKDILPFPAFLLQACNDGTLSQQQQLITFRDEQQRKSSQQQQQAGPSSALVAVSSTQDGQQQQQPIDLTGSYKLVKNDNFDAFLAAQGVPWALRRAAASVFPIHHHITHTGDSLTIRIEAGSGFSTQTVYRINGGPVETNVRGRIFQDEVRYYYKQEGGDDKARGIVTEKRAVTEGYVVTVTRCLSDDMSRIDMTSTASFPNEPAKETIVSTQVFERVVVA